jgi:hypothetical protein
MNCKTKDCVNSTSIYWTTCDECMKTKKRRTFRKRKCMICRDIIKGRNRCCVGFSGDGTCAKCGSSCDKNLQGEFYKCCSTCREKTSESVRICRAAKKLKLNLN